MKITYLMVSPDGTTHEYDESLFDPPLVRATTTLPLAA